MKADEPSLHRILATLADQLSDQALTDIFPSQAASRIRGLLREAATLLQPPAPAKVAPPVPQARLADGQVVLYTDGAAKGNPGEAGAGVFIQSDTGETLLETGSYLGARTNNVAEYLALLLGLRQAARLGASCIAIRVDSELMARQITGVYKVRDEKLQLLMQKIKTALSSFRRYTISHVPRAQNQRADQLANEAIRNKTVHADIKPEIN